MSKRRNNRVKQFNRDASQADESYITWEGKEGDELATAMQSMANAAEEYGAVEASYRRQTYSDIGGSGISGRPEYTMGDYDRWRPGGAGSKTVKGKMMQSDNLYRNVGLVKNIIDLMADFAVQGIRIVHPNPKIERFLRNWFNKVGGKERSERFVNYLYRMGNVVIRKQTAKIKKATRDRLMSTSGDTDMDIVEKKTFKNEIPWKYTFLHPATIDVCGKEIATFVGTTEKQYCITLPDRLRRLIRNPGADEGTREILKSVPHEIIAAAKTNKPVKLDVNKTSVYHYKKDDWKEWADPILASVFTDLSLLEQLKLADRSALDGAISNIRIFKLGSMEHKIAPNRAAIAKLSDILEANVKAGTVDLIWGPDIELIESKTMVHQFLGMTKYEPTLMMIYAGLGIPPTLTGTFGSSGTTNNFISLKTLTQRLEYGRDILLDFWNEELKIVQEAMGFKQPGKIEFDRNTLGDEESEKSILIQLADRGLISDELLQYRFGHDPSMEKIRVNREQRDRDSGKKLPKAGSFHDPQFGIALKKIALQTGQSTPGEMGLRLDETRKDLKRYPKEAGEKPALEMRQPVGAGQPGGGKKKGQTQQGRPKNKKDSTKRKTKVFKPKVKAAIEMWAANAHDDISDILNPMLFQVHNKKNMRSMSRAQIEEIDNVRFGILWHTAPLASIDHNMVYNALSEGSVPKGVLDIYNDWIYDIAADLDRPVTSDEKKQIQTILYTMNLQGEL